MLFGVLMVFLCFYVCFGVFKGFWGFGFFGGFWVFGVVFGVVFGGWGGGWWCVGGFLGF